MWVKKKLKKLFSEKKKNWARENLFYEAVVMALDYSYHVPFHMGDKKGNFLGFEQIGIHHVEKTDLQLIRLLTGEENLSNILFE